MKNNRSLRRPLSLKLRNMEKCLLREGDFSLLRASAEKGGGIVAVRRVVGAMSRV